MTPASSTARADIAAERARQQIREGFDAAHDDRYRHGELECAALTYIQQAETHFRLSEANYRAMPAGALWPWAAAWWKPHSPRRDLVRAGALLTAERDRSLRAGETHRDQPLRDAIDRVVGRIERLDAGGPPIAWVSPHECWLLLLLAGPVDLTEQDVAAWTQGEREEAADWSAKVYAVGGQLDKAPPMPAHVRMKLQDDSRVICAGCGHVGPPPPPPALSCCPERRPVPIDSDQGRAVVLTFGDRHPDLLEDLQAGFNTIAQRKAKELLVAVAQPVDASAVEVPAVTEFYLRKNDPFQPVYAVDPAAGRWWMAASRIGVLPELGGALPDGGARFQSDDFERVWPKAEADGVMTFTRDKPVETAAA